MDGPSLSSLFLEALPCAGKAPADPEALEAALRSVLETARGELGPLDEAGFLRHLASHTRGADPALAVRELHAADLGLAWACAQGDARALAELDRRVVATVPHAVARLRATGPFIEEVQQLLRQRLLVPGTRGAPRILDYGGRGPLTRWLRAAALRVALNLLDSQKQGAASTGDSGELERIPAAAPDPELAFVKQRYGPEFKEALEAALRGLPARERNFLRLYFVQGLTVDQIGRMQGAHKSTVSRWLARSREGLLAETRRLLRERLDVSPTELDSLMGLLRSQLDMSLSRILG